MKLPNAQNAVIEIEKLRDYCLNPSHPKGKHKARTFEAKLGLTINDAERLRQLIFEAILTAEAVEQTRTAHGQRFMVDFRLETREGIVISFAVIRTAWIIRNDEDFPRLTTCFAPRRSA